MKKAALIAAAAGLAVLLVLFPQNALESARYGLNLWLAVVVPSLFPFMTASFLLLKTGVLRLVAHVFAPITRALFFAPGEAAYIFAASALSGYPVGARLTGELYAAGQLNEADARHMVRFTSMSGPVFITGAVSTGLLGLPEAGVYLAAAHYLSAIAVGIIGGCLARRQRPHSMRPSHPCFADTLSRFRRDAAACPPFADMLADSVDKALMTLLKIGGFIMLFSVALEMLSAVGVMDALAWAYAPVAGLAGISKEGAQALLYGGVEMTTGCARAAAIADGAALKLPLISGIIAFGGLCIHMQTHAVLAGCGLKVKRFGLAKTVQAALAAALTSLLLALFPLTTATFSAAFNIKTAAFGGLGFAGAAFIVLLLIKLWQSRLRRRSTLPPAR